MVERSLSMREVQGSIPCISKFSRPPPPASLCCTCGIRECWGYRGEGDDDLALPHSLENEKVIRGRIRTCNRLIRGQALFH